MLYQSTMARAQITLKRPVPAMPNNEIAEKKRALVPARKIEVPNEIPFTLRGNHILIRVAVNDKPATFMVDSGAGENLITPQAVERLGLKIGTEKVSISGIIKSNIDAVETQIPSLSVGKFTFIGMTASVYQFPGVTEADWDGMLGSPFINSQIVSIDYEQNLATHPI